MAAVIVAGIAAAPAEAQNVVLDTMQTATQATANAAQATANAAQSTAQATANVQQAEQAEQAAQANPLAAVSATAPVATQVASAPVPMTKCSPAPSPQLFRACLELTMHRNGSWQAAHPGVAQAKSSGFGSGVGGNVHSIPAPSHTQN